jgi:hypothetical protein
MRTLAALVSVGMVVGAFACGSTNKLPFDELAPVPLSGGSDASSDASKRTCYDDAEGGSSDVCECTLPAGFGLSATVPCGVGLCSSATGQEAFCTSMATVVMVPGCPRLDADASADGGRGYGLPPCDAGSARLDAGADAAADAAADASAGPSAR